MIHRKNSPVLFVPNKQHYIIHANVECTFEAILYTCQSCECIKSFLIVLFTIPILHSFEYILHARSLCYIYYTARADYISGSVSGIAFLNFESTRLVSLCVAAAF